MNNNRKFGIEIEGFGLTREELITGLTRKGIEVKSEGYNHSIRPHWKIVYDASIRADKGFEIVSPPLKGENGINQVRIVAETIEELGGQVNRSCGLHIHHDVNDFTLDHFKNIYSLYHRFENTIDEIMPVSRRGNNNTFCKSIQGKMEELKDANSLEEIRRIFQSRYYKLNVQSFWRHGTIEFRQHSGTVNAEKIINWILLTQLMVERSISGDVKVGERTEFNLKQFKKVLTRKSENNYTKLFKYYNSRHKKLAA